MLLMEPKDFPKPPFRSVPANGVSNASRSDDSQASDRQIPFLSFPREKIKEKGAAIGPETMGANRRVFRRAPQALPGCKAHQSAEQRGKTAILTGRGETFASFPATVIDDLTSGFGSHTGTETEATRALQIGRSVGWLHFYLTRMKEKGKRWSPHS